MNLPVNESYTSELPWVMKVILYGNIVSELFIYIGNDHIIPHSEMVCWQAANTFFSICSLLGIQYESRKRTEPTLTSVPWTVTVAHTLSNEVVITVVEVKWVKTRSLVLELDIFIKEHRVPQKKL